MTVLLVLLQIACAAWVAADARGRDFSTSRIARSPRGWCVGCLLLWIICFPLYLVARANAPRGAGGPPAVPPARGDWSHPGFTAPATAPERMSVPPPKA